MTACADTAQETIIETSVETTEQIETTVEETEETVVETEETEETVVETEVVVEREAVLYAIDGMSADEVYGIILLFADVSDDNTYSTFSDRFAVLPIEVPEDYPDSIEGGFRTWQFSYTPAEGEELDTIVGGRFGAMIYIADETTANELFNAFNDYLASNCGDAEETSYDGGQRVDYEDGCYVSISYSENAASYVVCVAVDINT
ncbi:MAG: hypothetical protein K6A37_08515 [Saccharofermentans sp.]|nr:hypothetical protein [Saccharofermentans sp.]